MKTVFAFMVFVGGGLVTGFFSPYAMLWIGPDVFRDGTPYLLALVGGMAGLALYLYRGYPTAIDTALGLVGAVFVPFLAFALLRTDITHRFLSIFMTTLGLLAGVGASKAFRLRRR